MIGGNLCAWSLQRITLKVTNSRKCSQKICPAMTCPRGILSSIELIGHWQRDTWVLLFSKCKGCSTVIRKRNLKPSTIELCQWPMICTKSLSLRKYKLTYYVATTAKCKFYFKFRMSPSPKIGSLYFEKKNWIRCQIHIFCHILIIKDSFGKLRT